MPEVAAFAKANVRWIVAGLLGVVLVVSLVRGDEAAGGAPADAATQLVPADALVYLHLSTDPAARGRGAPATSPGASRATTRCAARCSRASRPRPAASTRTRSRATRPRSRCSRAEATRSTAGSLVLLDTGSDEDGNGRRRSCGGVQVQRIGQFLAVGQTASLDRAVQLAAGKGRSLAEDERFTRATEALPEGRVADGWASQDGVRRLLAPQGGLLGAAGVLLDQPGLVGAAVGVTAEGDQAKVTVRSELDQRARRTGAGASFKPFKPSLQDSAPAGALAYLGVSQHRVRRQPRHRRGGLDVVRAHRPDRARSAAGSDPRRRGTLNRDLLSLFRGETAIILTPSIPAPTLTVVAKTDDERRTRRRAAGAACPARARADHQGGARAEVQAHAGRLPAAARQGPRVRLCGVRRQARRLDAARPGSPPCASPARGCRTPISGRTCSVARPTSPSRR